MDRFQTELQESLSKLGISLKGLAEMSGVPKGKQLDEDRGDRSRGRERGSLTENRDFLRRLDGVRARRRVVMNRSLSESRRRPGDRTSALMEDLRSISKKLLGEEGFNFPSREAYHDGSRLSMTNTVERVPAPYTAVPASEIVKTFRGVADVADVISTRLTEAQRFVGKGKLDEMQQVLRALAEIANEAEEKAKELEKHPDDEIKPDEPVAKKMSEALEDYIADLQVAAKFAGKALREAGLVK